MKRAEKVKLISEFIARKKACDEQMEALQKLTGAGWESPLFNAVYRCVDAGLDALCAAVGDLRNGWLSWFIYENDCGDGGLIAGIDGKVRRVQTVAQLVKLIEASERHA